MVEIKVILIENPNDPMAVLRECLKQNGCQVSVCTSGFDALDELINSGGHIIVMCTHLPDITAFQLSCLLKSTPVTSTLPIVIVASELQDTFWSRASLADAVLRRQQVEQNEQDSVKFIRKLAEKNPQGLTVEQIDNEPVITGTFGSADLIKSFGELLNGLLAERLLRHYTRKLHSTVHDKTEFTTDFFDLLSRLFKPDICGIICLGPSPWSVYHATKSINDEILIKMIKKALLSVGLSAQIPANFYGEAADKKGAQLQKARILTIPAPDGTSLGAILIGWTSDKDIDNVLKTSLELLKDQIAPVMQLLIEKDKYQVLEAQASYWSMVDPISGLYNMEFFMGYLQQQLLFSQRQKLDVGLCIIDVDGFVGLAAQYGSDTGNLLLKTLAERLSSCIRSSDLMARYSGDQFVIVLPNTDLKGATILGEKLRSEAEKLNPKDEAGKKNARVTISVGCAQFNHKDVAPEAIIKDAKDALIRAKEKGRNCVSD